MFVRIVAVVTLLLVFGALTPVAASASTRKSTSSRKVYVKSKLDRSNGLHREALKRVGEHMIADNKALFERVMTETFNLSTRSASEVRAAKLKLDVLQNARVKVTDLGLTLIASGDKGEHLKAMRLTVEVKTPGGYRMERRELRVDDYAVLEPMSAALEVEFGQR